MKPGGRKVPTDITNKAVTIAGWTKVNGKRHVEIDTPINNEDGMEYYSVNVGLIDVMFMCGNGKGFNIARGLKQFISAARAIDKDFAFSLKEAKTTTFASQQTYQTRRKASKNTSVTGSRLKKLLEALRSKPSFQFNN
jgi:hypothetical protein